MRFMKFFTDFVFRFRKAILVIVGLITLFFGWQLTKLKIDSDIVNSLPKTDRAVALYNKLGDYFGGNGLALVVVESEDVFSPRTIEAVAKLTAAFKNIDGISSVTSLTDILDIKDAGDGSLEVGKLIDPENIPTDKAELALKKRYALSKEMYDGRLIAHNGKSTVIACLLKQDANKPVVSRQIKKAALDMKLPEKLYFGGTPFIDTDIADMIFKDIKTLIPVVSVLIILVLYMSFGSFRGVLVPLVSVVITNIWILGLMSMLNAPITVISDVIPVLLIAIGTAPSIHILSKYEEDRSRYGSTDEGAKQAFAEVGWRVIVTSLTIVFGFTSFIFGSYLTMIRDFGIFTSIGVVFMLVVAVFFVPAALSFVRVDIVNEKLNENSNVKNKGIIKKAVDALGEFVFKNEVAIITASVIIFCGSLFFVNRIERKVDMLDFFRKNHPARAADNMIKNNFGGARPIQVVVTGDIQNPYVLKEMRAIEKFLDYQPNLSNSQSVAGLLAEMNEVMDNDKIVPDSRDKIQNLWFFLEGQDIVNQMVDSDKEHAMVQVLLKDMDLKLLNKNLAAVEEYLDNAATELAVLDTYALKGTDIETVAAYRAKRAAEFIMYDAGKKDESTAVNAEIIAGILKDEILRGEADTVKSFNKIKSHLPPNLIDDQRFIKDVKNDIAELKQRYAAVPIKVYNTMSEKKPAPVEEVRFKLEYTGIPLIFKHLDDSLLKSQVESFAYAMIFIYVLLVLQLRSFVGAFFGMAPILMIVAFMFGIMGAFHIPLDVATVLAASVALGIGIDYSIHFSLRFKNNYFNIPDHLEALDETLRTTGLAIAVNVAAVTMGFVTLIFASLVPLSRFGILVAITMIGSGLGAVTLLPALFLITKGRFIGSLSINKNTKKGETK